MGEVNEKRVIGLVNGPFTPAQIELVRQAAEAQGWEVRLLSQDGSGVEDCEILTGYVLPEMLKRADKLRWLQIPSAGADRHVDENLYPHPGVILTNSSGAFGVAIAEQLLMGALMLLRRMPEYQAQQKAKIWKGAGKLRFLHGSRVVILGTGNLGGTFANYCAALGATVIGVSRSGKSENPAFSKVYPTAQLKEAVAGADVVAACLPLTGETKGLLDKSVFETMGKQAIFLNVGRGKTVVQKDLIEALKTGAIAGAMLDVTDPEPLPEDDPLWNMDNVILTPHISGSDGDNGDVIFDIFYQNLLRYFAGEELHNVVDRRLGY